MRLRTLATTLLLSLSLSGESLAEPPASAPKWELFDQEDGIRMFRRDVPGSSIVALRGEGFVEAPIARVASVLVGPDVDILERGVIPVGRIVFETLSASLDPYPRRPGAEFTWQDQHQVEPEETSPFAVLSQLKDKK